MRTAAPPLDRNRSASNRFRLQEIRLHLEALGWLAVSASGVDQPFDLIALPSVQSLPLSGVAGKPRWLGLSLESSVRHWGASRESDAKALRDLAEAHGGTAGFVRVQGGRWMIIP